MTETAPDQPVSFAYQAQTAEGHTVAGTIDAANFEHAQRLLQNLRLRVLQIEPSRQPPRTATLGGDDFLTFNQQLAHLTTAGLPIDHGLRLIAQDMRTGRLKATVRQVAEELERGTPIDQAFEKHRDKFPPLYASLIAAGVATSNLPALLLNLGRHMEMIYRLRAMLWRVFSYPLMVLLGIGLILFFLTFWIIPQFETLFSDFGVRLPLLTELILSSRGWMPWVLLAIAIVIIAIPLFWMIAKLIRIDRAVLDAAVRIVPLVGPVLKRNLIARWCDAVRLGVQAGLDLPRSIELAGEAIASPALMRDGREVIGAIASGRSPDAVVDSTRLLPATALAAITLGSEHRDLPQTLATLSEMYQQQAENRLNLIPGLLAPLLILSIALVIGLIIIALFLPFISLIQAISGG